MNNELYEFTRQALAKGLGRDEIAAALEQAGWDKVEVKAALAAFADIPFALPVPRPRPFLSAGEYFMYLLMFAALYDAAWSLGSLAFAFIDRAFQDPAFQIQRWKNFSEVVRWDVASLIVSFPVFLAAFRWTNKNIVANPARRGSRPRKWLTYLTLFIAAMTMAGDLITLIYNMLGGELTARFLLKVAVVAVLAGGVFTYFLMDIRRDETE